MGRAAVPPSPIVQRLCNKADRSLSATENLRQPFFIFPQGRIFFKQKQPLCRFQHLPFKNLVPHHRCVVIFSQKNLKRLRAATGLHPASTAASCLLHSCPAACHPLLCTSPRKGFIAAAGAVRSVLLHSVDQLCIDCPSHKIV